MSEELARCVGVSRTYGQGTAAVVAVHSLDCAVRPASRVALTGRSGSGKSTLVHLLAGLDQPTTGEVSWPGLGGAPTGRPGVVGVVFQGPSLLAPLDVAENVALPLLLAGVRPADADARAGDALRRAGVADLAGKLPEELSGGQAQRVAVARVLASAPRLILADEPTGQLDAAHRDEVVTLLIEAAEELRAGLIIATHDARVADRLPQRWIMDDGRLQEVRQAC
ncbi:ABC transporter ATP-binding protein [Dactylosporangium darangshiense]|uniref:ATP-binding cassette domain-containing protein n=1 Tax=Dactylosporangium darangshiense TaxID=579108 RepID=A0ABP8DVT4_9ACTN